MAIPTLTAPPATSGLQKNMKPRVLGLQFGDGYSQTAPDGINTMLMSLPVSWKDLTFAEADAIDQFLNARGGVEYFFWQKPRESGVRKWRCGEWSVTDNQTLADVTATFEEQP